MNIQTRGSRNQYLPISVLNPPAKGTLIEVTSESSEYNLFYQSTKKIHIEAYRVRIPKSKLFTSLETHSWRLQTEFPISKTFYVNIKENNLQQTQIAEMLVYVQSCPWRLASLKSLSFTQAIYLLKEAMIGFERLLKKFGTFAISQKMIRINEKGLCRVWMNQNFGDNSYQKSGVSQEKMVKATKQILQRYCHYSKTSQKLFSKINEAKTFISALKQIDNFAVALKIIVPYRFIFNEANYENFSKSPSKTIRTQFMSSRKLPIFKAEDHNINVSLYIKQSVSMQKVNRNGFEKQISKINSSQNIGVFVTANTMKKSDGETTYTRNIKEPKNSNMGCVYCSPRDLNAYNFRSREKRIEDTSFTVELEKNKGKPERKDKKDLYYSEAGINPEELSISKENNRSFSPQGMALQMDRKLGLNKKSQSHSYADEFNSVLEDSHKQSARSQNKRRSQLDEEQVDKLRESHTETVIKNNGWKSFTGLLVEQNQELNESFVEGQEENLYIKEIKLEKLESLGRKARAMSILPQEFQDII